MKNSGITLVLPYAAVTQNSIALLWNRPEKTVTVTYHIILNNEKIDSCNVTDYTIKNLESDTEYKIQVNGVEADGSIVASNIITGKTKPVSEVFNIQTYGAVADGRTINTRAIQSAVNACSEGGTVYVPKGTFVTGALFLKSRMTLYLEEGSVLLGSTDPDDYPVMRYRFEGLETECYASLINTEETTGKNLYDITVAGDGTIDANGSLLLKAEIAEGKGKRGRAICIRHAEDCYLYGITVRQSPAWCVHMIYCNRISLNQVKIHTKYNEKKEVYQGIWNGDGFDPDSSSNIMLFHSMIDSQDDCVAIKSGRNKEGRIVGIPSENIRISNCIFKSGFGVAIGSEMSGDVRNVLVQDCDFIDTFSVASVKAPRGRGGVIENVSYERIRHVNNSTEHTDCEWFRGAIYIDQFYSHKEFDDEEIMQVDEDTPIIQNIEFTDISVDTAVSTALYLTGLPESPLRNIQCKRITAKGKHGIHAVNVSGLVLEDTIVTAKEETYCYKNISSMEIRNNTKK